MGILGYGDGFGAGCGNDTTRAVHKSKVAGNWPVFGNRFQRRSGYQIATKLTISRFDHADTAAQRVPATRRDPNRPMRFINILSSSPFNRLTRLLDLDFGAHPHHRAGADPGGRLSRQRAHLRLRRRRRRHRLRDRQAIRRRSPTPAAISRARSRQMRIVVKDFSAAPSTDLVVSFAQAHALALQSLDTIAASIDRRHAARHRRRCARTSWTCATTSTNWCSSRTSSASTKNRACAAICAKPATRSSASSTRT